MVMAFFLKRSTLSLQNGSKVYSTFRVQTTRTTTMLNVGWRDRPGSTSLSCPLKRGCNKDPLLEELLVSLCRPQRGALLSWAHRGEPVQRSTARGRLAIGVASLRPGSGPSRPFLMPATKLSFSYKYPPHRVPATTVHFETLKNFLGFCNQLESRNLARDFFFSSLEAVASPSELVEEGRALASSLAAASISGAVLRDSAL